MWAMNAEEDLQWQLRRNNHQQTDVQISASHRALFERVEQSISSGFASAQRALVDLQLQLQVKVRQLRDQQQAAICENVPLADEFEAAVIKIDRSLEAFTVHAHNLTRIKLTLSRAAAFVSLDGNLTKLIDKVFL